MTSENERIEKAKALAEFCIQCAEDKKAEEICLGKKQERNCVEDILSKNSIYYFLACFYFDAI